MIETLLERNEKNFIDFEGKRYSRSELERGPIIFPVSDRPHTHIRDLNFSLTILRSYGSDYVLAYKNPPQHMPRPRDYRIMEIDEARRMKDKDQVKKRQGKIHGFYYFTLERLEDVNRDMENGLLYANKRGTIVQRDLSSYLKLLESRRYEG